MKTNYDETGKNYATGRATDPRIAAQIHAKLRGAESVLNIGAGSGSYEPSNINVTAVEPSERMIKQRGALSAPVMKAQAESLPFNDGEFSHCMTVLSMHHWSSRPKAFSEIKRVTRDRFVAITWDPESYPFWLSRDYFPEIYDIDQTIFPKLAELNDTFDNIDVEILELPADCIDGFMAAYWQRPEAYLDDTIRENMSTFSKIGDLESGIARLRKDLDSGTWKSRNQSLINSDTFDAGYRLITVDL